MTRESKGFEARNRPDWLYNALPYVYIAMGLTVPIAIGTSNLIAVFSGILLVSTGGVVVTMRAAHRQEMAKLRAEIAETDHKKEELKRAREETRRLNGESERREADRREAERRTADRRDFGADTTAVPSSKL